MGKDFWALDELMVREMSAAKTPRALWLKRNAWAKRFVSTFINAHRDRSISQADREWHCASAGVLYQRAEETYALALEDLKIASDLSVS